MSGITLLTDGSKYSKPLKQALKRGGDEVVLLSDPEQGESAGSNKKPEIKTDGDHAITWNKRSPLSARNSVLTVMNSLGAVDRAVLIYQAGDYSKTFHETSSAVYDLQIDRWIKGYGYLLKEIIQLFLKQQHGDIVMILDTEGMKVMTPLESAIFSFLKSLFKNLSVLYQNEAMKMYCFEADTSRTDDFLDFFQKTINDSKYSAGKIHHFSDKKSLFNFSKN